MTGAELRALRLAKGYSLTALAKALGRVVTTVCRYQSGKLTIPPEIAERVELLPRRK